MTVICYNCRDENSDQARFCKHCRTPLRCAQCDTPLKLNMRFCPKCGASRDGAPPMNPMSGGQAFVRAMAFGDRLHNRYIIVRPLGKGGMGAVYLVEDARFTGRQLALKEMSEQGIDPVEARAALEAFKREAQLLAQLDHANLPKVFDNFSERNRHFLVMEFVPGKTLEKRLEEASGPLPEREVYGYAVQLCDVLDYLHRQQPPIIFRDLKPANIMLKPDGRIKLIDFGIARHFKPGQSKDTQAMGTPGYAAPEQYGKGQSDARTDVYALGATLHHAITGRDPGQDPFNFLTVRALNRAASPQIETAIMKAVLIDRNQRWPSIAALRAGMDTNILAPPPVAVGVPPPRPVAPPPVPQTQTPPATQAATFKRASFWQYVFLTVGMGIWMASPISPPLFIEMAVGSFGFWYGTGIGFLLPLMLTYLLTHRPLSTVVPLVILVAIAPVFPNSAFWWGLSFSNSGPLFVLVGVLELLLMFTGWRTRNWLGLSLILLATLFLLSFFGLFFFSFVSTGIAILVGVAIALLISNLVNHITGVGR
jgi:serine/threonine-protein kinase